MQSSQLVVHSSQIPCCCHAIDVAELFIFLSLDQVEYKLKDIAFFQRGIPTSSKRRLLTGSQRWGLELP